MALSAGTRLGPYEILAPLGAGGMGEVYRATDTKLAREVAIKVLPTEVAQDPERLARFQREATLLAALNHPHIAAIYGLEEEDQNPFLVLELVEGEDLAERLKRGPIPIDEALEIARQIAEALEEAHEKGIIHRDLKPANVKITPDGNVKVLDFGLAKAWGGDSVTGSSSDLSQSPTLAHSGTQAGVILGTAAYMSPEQARGKPVDKRADIWAFGVVLFEMLTGQRLFSGDEVSDTLASILKDEPDWTLLPADTPRKLSDLLRRCLRKDARSRLRDIGDARIEIGEAMSGPTGGLPGPATSLAERPWWRRALPWALAVLAVMATGLAAWSLMRPTPRESRPVARTSIVLPPGERLARASNRSVAVISPDGSRLAYVARREDTRPRLYLRALDQPEAAPLPGTEGASSPFFSPDGQWLGFFARGELKKISVTGGAATTLCDSQGSRGGTWAPDDTIIFAEQAGGLRRISASGGTPEVLTSPDVTKGQGVHAWPEILPGGKAVLYSVYTPDGVTADDAHIAVLSLDTGEETLLLEGGHDPLYAPTGHLIYARAGSLRAVKFDLERLKVTEPSLQVLAGVRTNKEDGAPSFEFSDNGTLVYVRGGPQPDRTLVWVNRQGVASAITQDDRGYRSPRLSPDGQRIAVLIGWTNHNVWIYDLTRGTFSPLTHRWDNHNPVWTPDGQRVVFDSTRSGRNVFWRSADGSGDVEPLLETDQEPSPTSISPDGVVLALMQLHSSRGQDILLYSMDGKSEPREFLATEVHEGNPNFSPDGRWIAYQSNETGQGEVYVKPFPGPGASVRISTEGGYRPVWAPSGRELFYRDRDKMMAVAIETEPAFGAGSPRLLFAGRYLGGDYDISPDGEHFLMIREPETKPVTQLQVVFNWFEELKAKMREAEE